MIPGLPEPLELERHKTVTVKWVLVDIVVSLSN